ncbi:putative gtpase gap [Erysiphe neolycopersici]|uniref:Putative gtpase gap n=1 Tax=Erysiphe neolycopersici TaxID=212602 RepID=A0A420HX20_9PEZI|nr:putative gtpase gap [Erysiphe neolycopersici]
MISRASAATKSEGDQDKPLPTSDSMDYGSLDVIFGPIIIGDLVESHSMQIANPNGGLILLPISPPKSRKEKKRNSRKICDELKEVNLQMDKIEMANKITEMIIAEWCDVVQHIKNLTYQNQEWSKKRSSTCSPTQPTQKPYVSENYSKNSFERSKSIPAKAICKETLPSVMKVLEPSTTERSESNENAKQSSAFESFVIKRRPVEESFCMPSPIFSEAPNKRHGTRSRRRKLASLASTGDFSQSCCQTTTNNKNFDLKNLDMSFALGAPIEKSYEDLVRNAYTPRKAESSIKCNNVARLRKNRSYLPVPTERRLKISNFRSKRLSLGQKTPPNQGEISTQEPVEIFHDKLGMCSQILSRNSVKSTPSYLFCVSDSDLNLKPLTKNHYALDPLNENPKYHSRILTLTENGSFVTEFQDKDITFSEKLSKVLDQRSRHTLNLSHEAKYDNNMIPDRYLCQNEDRIMKRKFDYINQNDQSITPLGSVTRSASHSNKMSHLLAKFENEINPSPNLNEPTESMNRSDQSGNRLLGEYTKNSPLKAKKSIESDATFQKAISYKYPNPDPEIIRSKDLDSRRSLINLKDTPSLSLRRVKSFIEKPIKKTTNLSSAISRPLSVTNQINGQYMMSSEVGRGVRKVLNNSSLSSCSKQESTIQFSSARKLAGRSDTGTEEDGGSKYLNSSITFAPGRSNPLLYEQVRVLQRQLDKKCEEVQKLKQQAGTWHDITIGTLKKNLEDSKRHTRYWQEKAKFFELRFYSLHQALSSQNSHEQMYLSHEANISRSNSNLDDFSTAELAYRLPGPSHVDKWETKSWNSECSNGTVIRGLRKCVTESELSSWLK